MDEAVRPRRTRAWSLGVLVVLVVVSAAGAGFGLYRPRSARPTGTAPAATATVTRVDLVEQTEVNGTLGYGDPRTLSAHGGGGTLTSVAPVGTTVVRGQALYTVDTRPVTLLYGTIPAYRPLKTGDKGADVRQLEENLTALGYGGFTVDDTFSDATAAAVKRWQGDRGLDRTGDVQPTQVVYAPGPIRIAGHKAESGDPATGDLLTYTGTRKLVHVDLKVDDLRLVAKGTQVSVVVPGQPPVPGTVTTIDTVATAPANSTGGANQPAPANAGATVGVTVELGDDSKVAAFDGAPVTVRIVAQRREHALSVPVEALLALREGGFGVEVVEGGGSRIVPVQTGLFADGRVEIVEGALNEGMRVGVPG